MRNFERVAEGLDVQPLLDALAARPELWGEITIRQHYPGSAHKDTEAIFLRGPYQFTFRDYMMDTTAYDYPAMDALSAQLVPLVRPVLQQLGVTELGYVMLVRLAPGGVIKPHVDEGAYADHYSRLHLALTGEPGATLTAGDETQHFAPGECWWFNHKVRHSAVNDSDQPRIHLIIDAVTPRFAVHVPS